jgi:hypothetical protein
MVGAIWDTFIGETAIGDLTGWSHAARAGGVAGVRTPGPHAGGIRHDTPLSSTRLQPLLVIARIPE